MPSDLPINPSAEGLPLVGVTVVEAGHSVAAPFAGAIFAQLGADVVKVEMPGRGDHTRDWGPPYRDGVAVIYQAFNRDKRSIVVDLSDEEERNGLKSYILEEVDVVIQNLRPGVMEKYGLDSETLCTEKPSLIYCNLSAYGQTGPMRNRPGYDPLMQAFGGIMSVTGEEGRAPVRVGTSIVDMGAGMWSVIGVLSALIARSNSGCGSVVDTSLYETAIGWMTPVFGTFMASGDIPKRLGSAAAQIVPYEVFETADGYLMIAAGSDGLFERLSKVLAKAEWAVDEKYATNGARVVNRHLLVPMIAEIVKTKATSYWEDALNAAQVPNAPLQNAKEVTENEQTKALGIIQTIGDQECSLIGLPLSFNGMRPAFRKQPPKLGEDTDRVLKFRSKTSSKK
ncbi:CoA transferase [Hyphococcus flavus]|uniref:CoA transferase n=1 Tax=Hyphococcus flavus TaxID=1866326 RepID=A0AAE9ZBG6_9PROT|nr:CoA transferase [Hyphococcus flavus]WDI30110.1 CoA transferase [Hyphococcus flavus]